MRVDQNNGLLTSVRYLSSPHCDERPENAPINMVVLHGITLPPGEFGTGSVERFFCGELDFSQHPTFESIKDMRASAHLFVNRKGEIIQFVPFLKRAWHAGKSFFQGQENCNDFSIGIEIEGTDYVPYEPIQYEHLAQVLKLLLHTYPKITRERIVGHSDVAPGRKTDPGPFFDWQYLDSIMNKLHF